MITRVEDSSLSSSSSSSLEVEVVNSMMDDTTSAKPNKALTKTNINDSKRLKLSDGKEKSEGDDEEDEDEEEEEEEEDQEFDVEAWDTLSRSFKKVQTVLDKNRELIQRVNENHQSKISDNISKNVSLIREINGNISKVISIYSDLSVDFANIVSQRKKKKRSRRMKKDDDGGCGCGVESSDG